MRVVFVECRSGGQIGGRRAWPDCQGVHFLRGSLHHMRGDSIFLHPFLHAQNRPDLLFPLSTTSNRGRETQAVQSRFAIGNTHLKNLERLFSCYRSPQFTQCGRAFGHYRTAIVTAWQLAALRACMRPFSPLLHPLRVTLLALTWEGSPVVSQCSYGGVMRHYLHPVMQSLGTCLGWVLSPTSCAANFGQRSNEKAL